MFERCWETQCQWVHPNQKLWDCRLQGQTNPERAPDQRTQIWMNLASGILTWSCHKVRKCGSSSPASGHTDFWMGPSRFRWHRPAKRSAGSAWKKHQYSQALTQADLHWSWRSNIVANHTIAVSILAKKIFLHHVHCECWFVSWVLGYGSCKSSGQNVWWWNKLQKNTWYTSPRADACVSGPSNLDLNVLCRPYFPVSNTLPNPWVPRILLSMPKFLPGNAPADQAITWSLQSKRKTLNVNHSTKSPQ